MCAVKLDAQSRVLWAKDNAFNHDISVAADGANYMLEQKTAKRDEINPNMAVRDDHITWLTPDGAIAGTVSLIDCILNSPCRPLLDRILPSSVDIFHANTAKVVTAEQARAWPLAKPGMVLVSMRQLHTIALVDPQAQKVVWWNSDTARYQHEPTITPDGNLLLFDNFWCPGRSRALEIDPRTGDIVWQYGGTAQQPFFSWTCSTTQYLPDGSRRITVSEEGRAFTVDRANNVIWQYASPDRTGDRGELVATLFQCERLPDGFPTGWTGRGTSEE